MSPRPARNESPLNLYHVLVCGNNKEDIFIDDEDKSYMVRLLYEKSENNAYDFFAYSILYNRANLLIRPRANSLSEAMKRINTAYASYFNKKYSRCGHVFQDRYRSEPILDESMVLPVIRYIHENPVLEGLCRNAADYPFSSCREDSRNEEKRRMEEREQPQNSDLGGLYCCFGYYDGCFANMQKIAQRIIEEYMNQRQLSLDELKQKEQFQCRRELVVLLRRNTGYSIRKISQLLQINRGEVYKIINEIQEDTQ